MKALGLIPARGGSKRIPKKNLRPLGDVPLVVRAVESARQSGAFCDLLLSTDDQEIAALGRSAGALVPWLRPVEHATDMSTAVAVALHALDWYESERGQVDALVLLQPTSPFRKPATILRALELFDAHDRRPVISLSPCSTHPLWCFRVEGSTMRPFIESEAITRRSQDLPPAYVPNGVVFVISPDQIRRTRSFYHDEAVPLLVTSAEESVDIDTETDWKLAEFYLSLKQDGSVGRKA